MTSFISALLALCQALPALVSLLNEIVTFVKKAAGDTPQAYVVKLGDALNQLNSAQTDDDKAKASKAISDAIRGL